ncbi:MAG: hypothetical protein A2289_11870 [Deltaproteobacteria bacterium RIFOXYA12_FULL_58_15]|nr:MAG: hypothetical protein A2289_11870 [Deltaproteobacteria bacterium RIFOXYA12_FULL_58_15]OGR10881.1 MAG: hypothetical protein A2341_02170 [Deltaproteobacteria bacterium RIFOXYB12_FULL_58_9]
MPKRLCLHFLLILVLVALGSVASAAEITDVADAADTIIIGDTERPDPFDLYMGVAFRMHLSNGKITREPLVRQGLSSDGCEEGNSRDCLPVDEAEWERGVNVLDIKSQIGIFHDLAAVLNFHYVLGDTTALKYAKGVTPDTSSIDPKTGDANDSLFVLGETFDDGFRSKHTGWGNIDEFGYRTGGMDFGLKWAALSDERDESKPMWQLSFIWSNPWLADAFSFSKRASEDKPGSVGDGVHYLTFGTALSKRIGNFGLIGIDPNENRRGYIDPYMEFTYTLPVPSAQAPKALTRSYEDFGRKPPHRAELNAGMEIVAVEDLKNSRKVAIDLGIRTAFYSEGRSYGLLSDALGEMTYVEQAFGVRGLLGLYIQAAEFLRFQAGLSFGYMNEHFVTYEEVGSDENGDNQVLPPDSDLNTEKDVINPYFCHNSSGDVCSEKNLPSYDQVGFRFKDEQHVVFSWFASLIFTF